MPGAGQSRRTKTSRGAHAACSMEGPGERPVSLCNKAGVFVEGQEMRGQTKSSVSQLAFRIRLFQGPAGPVEVLLGRAPLGCGSLALSCPAEAPVVHVSRSHAHYKPSQPRATAANLSRQTSQPAIRAAQPSPAQPKIYKAPNDPGAAARFPTLSNRSARLFAGRFGTLPPLPLGLAMWRRCGCGVCKVAGRFPAGFPPARSVELAGSPPSVLAASRLAAWTDDRRLRPFFALCRRSTGAVAARVGLPVLGPKPLPYPRCPPDRPLAGTPSQTSPPQPSAKAPRPTGPTQRPTQSSQFAAKQPPLMKLLDEVASLRP
ncbi:hypothetical protein BDY21DRAFT_367012 [Lineolata rhizophorae]|uniref:Uncharacterized protein n=1 Tax=Lineolata rhizophorae TaxID=578093 RepID=A0A6A6NP24_9PEZI|nr:hypothetical protein BDY21DRAFT_367012 [Lineolata rhizophorae]